MSSKPTYSAGDRVRSTVYFGEQFPQVIACNKGQPMRGVVKRVREDGLLSIHWDGRVYPVTISRLYIEPEGGLH